jgi:hypothetical protein
MAGGPDYATWHRTVGTIIHEITGQRCRVVERTVVTTAPGFRTFELGAATSETMLERIDRARGGRTPVVPMFPVARFDSPTIWLSWYERWKEQGIGLLVLIDMSASFYWGLPGRHRIQLFRAEWAADENAPQTSAQPHWQVDTDFIGNANADVVSLAPETEGSVELVELPVGEPYLDDMTAIISISRLHLGMAGWKNGATYPAWWRCQLGADEAARREWLRRTLQHAADQFKLVTVD